MTTREPAGLGTGTTWHAAITQRGYDYD